MSGGGSAPESDPNIGKAAMLSAQTGASALDYMKSQAAITNQWAQEDRNRQQTVFQPLQDAYIEKANNWDSGSRLKQVAAEAKADVMSNAAAAQQQNNRQMAAMGVNPNSGRFANSSRATTLATGLAAAGAQNNARSQARNEATQLQTSAINMGNGLSASALGAMGSSNNAYSTGVNAALSGYGQQGTLLNQQYQNQMATYNANQQNSLGGVLGSLAGTALGGLTYSSAAGFGWMSDEDVKQDKRKVNGILDAVKKMRVESWRYKEGAGDDGASPHVGTYAQDFHKATGLGDGRMIGVMDALGINLGALKELAAKVDKLERKAA